VHEVAYRGEVSIVLVRLPSGRELRATITNAHRGASVLARDESVYVSWSSDAPMAGAT
jgi:hypothetical protein